MENNIIVQKLRVKVEDSLQRAIRYYTILSSINDLDMTEREVQLVAFTSIKGNISYSSNREEFCKLYKSSSPTINNMISKLKKIGVLVKDNAKIKVNPKILLDFNKEIILKITLDGQITKSND